MLKLKRNSDLNNSLLTLEASAERERVKKFMNDNLGNGYFDKYLKVRDRLTDPNMKDFNKIINLDPEDVKVAIDRYNTTPTGKRTVGENSDWIVYHVTDFRNAQELGEGSEWCITGRYPNTDPDDPHYFNNYIRNYNLDGGYYFYIPKDGSYNKYCLLLTKNGDINSIWATPNHKLRSEDLEELNFPTVRGINLDDYNYDGDEGYDNYYDGEDIDRFREQMEDAYRNDDADTWDSCAYDIQEAGGNVDYPYLDTLFEDNKPNIFDRMLDMGISLESDDIEYILDGLYLRQINSPSDWLPMINDNIDPDDLGACIGRMIDHNSYAGLDDFIRDFHTNLNLFYIFYTALDFENLIDFLNREEITKEALDAVTYTYSDPKIIDILDSVDILEQGGYILDFLEVLNKKGIDVKPAFEEGRVLNLAGLLLDEDNDLSDIDGDLIEGLIKLGAQIKPDEIKALKERIDSLDEDDREYIDQEILDLVEKSA